MAAEQYEDIIAFASDFSGGDPAIVERVREMAAAPPTDMETVGFYGGEDYPERSRVFLATVSLLEDAGKLSSIEDKYSAEIFAIWAEDGTIIADALPPLVKAVFGPLRDGEEPAGGVGPYRELVWQNYAQATKDLEHDIAARGKVLLSVDATEGDTMFFALVTPAVAERWQGRALSEQNGYQSGVRPPMWDRLWDNLLYSTGGLMADETQKGLPPGTAVSTGPLQPYSR